MLAKTYLYSKPIKALGQNFLNNQFIAKAEAVHAYGKNVIEIGPGYGMLTRELCKHASRVVAIEKDQNLYRLLKVELKSRKLLLLNKDFFKASDEELRVSDTQIMISNVPYNLSSKVIEWLLSKKIEAVLCLQKEFVEHMLAKPGTEKYSRLSVMSSLCFSMTKIIDVPKGNFIPVPKVDSAVIYLKPKSDTPRKRELELISMLMQHKNKRLRNALLDSHATLGMEKSQILSKVKELGSDLKSRPYNLSPSELLLIACRIAQSLQKE
ncbi:MAG: ribosomal RNA small subunit methyltransferase A [Candidatus Micrarchaeota archaeon]|nr:ribosomal RNA small subunit methyltransferase A [Candidatus Micrarchaeota archaeon]MDE1847512.1 ribosomal RNA small subunit methyltransferase A [Candidatus Micrarchaeota archaeon]MDE1863852.1 ribosomal RNA small subunit methyltransferase A [Candidatus Micrarchaeota archaeon]